MKKDHVKDEDIMNEYMNSDHIRYIDMHCDTVSALYQFPKLGHLNQSSTCIDAAKLRAGGALCQYFANFVAMPQHGGEFDASKEVPGENADAAFEYVLRLLDFFEKENETVGFRTVRSATDCDAMAIKAGICAGSSKITEKALTTDSAFGSFSEQIFALLTVEEGGILNYDMSRLDQLYDRGIRLVTLTWNYENCFGFPNSRDASRMALGLKPFGIETVQRMLELGMMVDVSHLSDGGFYDVAKICKSFQKPFVASHSCARTLCSHPRNLTDDMLRILGEGGGVAGINFYGAFLNEAGGSDVDSMMRHIRHMVNQAGIEAVAIGTDFDGFDGGSEIADASQMPKLFEALRSGGFKEDEIEKIAWKNAVRVMREVLR